MTNVPLRFPSDAALRKRLWTAEAFSHPAKANLHMMQAIIERYTQPGDWILDPMAGVGSTLIGALMGRNVIALEKEHHFLLPMARSWAQMRTHPMLGEPAGEVQMLWGDARRLGAARPWPYGELAVRFPKDTMSVLKARRRKRRLPLVRDLSWLDGVSHVVLSPPYEGIAVSAGDQARDPGIRPSPTSRRKESQIRRDGLFERGYTRQVDAVAFSPPYEGSLEGSADSKHHKSSPNSMMQLITRKNRAAQDHNYAGQPDNIGNLRGGDPLNPDVGDGKPTYWSEMAKTYRECHRILRPGGLLVLILKGFTRDGEYQDLPGQTSSLVTSLGFVEHDSWLRELASLSFWRTLQATDAVETVVGRTRGLFDTDVTEIRQMKRVLNGKLDPRLRYESILAFRKPEGEGGGVAAVVTSPPWENQVPNHLGGSTDFSPVGGIGHERAAGYTRPAAVILSPPYEGTASSGVDGIDWTRQADGRKKQEPYGVGGKPFGYTQPGGAG